MIFDASLAKEYLVVAKGLGVEINLSKSIVSPSEPLFEFAKRTCWFEKDLSPIPFRLLLGNALADKVGQFLSLSSRALLTSTSLLLRIFTRFGSTNLSVREVGNPILSILGALAFKGLLPHRWLVESLIAPDEEFDFESASFQLPLVSSLKLILGFMPMLALGYKGDVARDKESILSQYPFSQREVREEIYDD